MIHSTFRLCSASVLLVFITACTTSPPSDVNNICSIFSEKKGFTKIFDPHTDGRNYTHPCYDYSTPHALSLVPWLEIDK